MSRKKSQVTLEDSINFWRQEKEKLADDLLSYLRALSTKISNVSKTFPFYLYLNWREMSGSDWIQLRLASHFLENSPRILLLIEDKLLNYVMRELKDLLARNAPRMRNFKKYQQFEMILSQDDLEDILPCLTEENVPKEREWRGNYQGKLKKILGRIYTLRQETPKRIERQERVRGYRDHGSMASKSEVARRQANTSSWNPVLEFAKSLVEDYNYSIKAALSMAYGKQRRN